MNATSWWPAKAARETARPPRLWQVPRLSALDVAWAVFSLLTLAAMAAMAWVTIPFFSTWIGLTVWHVRRKHAAESKYHRISEQSAQMLSDQRQLVQDAAHQLRTPITIALGHAELLAAGLAGHPATAGQELQDIQVVIGELNRLRRGAQCLLLIAASADPEFLQPEPVALDRLLAELLDRWRPTVPRRWRLGRLDSVTVPADADRLGLALDALVDNAVRHTAQGDAIELSVVRGEPDSPVRLIVADSGSGIPEDELPLIFDRFRTGRGSHSRGTGLGLALVRAVARAHGGDVTVRSTQGEGSEFALILPAPPALR